MAEDTKEPAERPRNSGQFVKGDPRINTNGPHRRVPEEVRAGWMTMTPLANQRLNEALSAEKTIFIGRDEGATIEKIPDHNIRLAAVEIIYQRLWGRPPQAITGDDGGPVQVEGVDLSKLSEVQFQALIALRNALKEEK